MPTAVTASAPSSHFISSSVYTVIVILSMIFPWNKVIVMSFTIGFIASSINFSLWFLLWFSFYSKNRTKTTTAQLLKSKSTAKIKSPALPPERWNCWVYARFLAAPLPLLNVGDCGCQARAGSSSYL